MLKRVLTGLALSAVTLCALLLGKHALWGLLFVCQMLCMWEMLSAVKSAGFAPVRFVYLLYAAALVPVSAFFGSSGALITILMGVLAAMTLVTLKTEPDSKALLYGLLPAVYPAIPMTALLLLAARPENDWRFYLFLTLCIPIGCDTFALFVGKAIGKHKLHPHVSPHKTVEGAVGGVFGAMLFAVAVWAIARFGEGLSVPPLWVILLLGFFGAFFSEVGDLAASYIKRVCAVKDFGWIFPGHGGMLDRMDSVMFSAVFILFVLSVFPL